MRLAALAPILLTSLAAWAGIASATPRCEGRLLRSTIEERQATTLALLRERKFDALQKRMEAFLDAYMAGRLADEELYYEFGAFDRWGPFLTPLFDEWVALHPRSFSARHAQTVHRSSVAWQKRGGAVARETSKQQFADFKQALAAAEDSAWQSLALHPRPILAYQQLMIMGRAAAIDTSRLGSAVTLAERSPLVPRPDLFALLQQSLRVQADNTIVREAYVGALAPRWGGSLEPLNEYAKPSTHAGSMSADRVASVIYTATMEIASDFAFRKRPDEAVEVYEVAARICKLNQPFVDIANIRLEQNRFADALAAADAVLGVVPGSATGRLLKMRALRGLARHDEAAGLARTLVSEGSSEAVYVLGEYHASGLGGVARDPVEARRLIATAARSGYKPAIRRLETWKAE